MRHPLQLNAKPRRRAGRPSSAPSGRRGAARGSSLPGACCRLPASSGAAGTAARAAARRAGDAEQHAGGSGGRPAASPASDALPQAPGPSAHLHILEAPLPEQLNLSCRHGCPVPARPAVLAAEEGDAGPGGAPSQCSAAPAGRPKWASAAAPGPAHHIVTAPGPQFACYSSRGPPHPPLGGSSPSPAASLTSSQACWQRCMPNAWRARRAAPLLDRRRASSRPGEPCGRLAEGWQPLGSTATSGASPAAWSGGAGAAAAAAARTRCS